MRPSWSSTMPIWTLPCRAAIQSKFRNNGQTCVCANRIYVQAGVYDAFAERLAEAVKTLKVGDGLKDGTDLGPLINEEAIAKVQEHVADAQKKGGKVIFGSAEHELEVPFSAPSS